MYYILTSKVANDSEDAILSGDSAYLKRIECSFRDGVELPAEDIIVPIDFYIDEFALRGTMTDHLSLNDIPGTIVSLKVKTLFDALRIKNVQYFQLRLRDEFAGDLAEMNKSNKKKKYVEYNNFFIANVVDLVDCVNHEQSSIEYFLPPELRNIDDSEDNSNNPFAGENLNEIDTIFKLVLDEEKISGNQTIFRLKDHPNSLVFHERIVEVIRKEKLSGFVFVPVEEYTDAIVDEDDEGDEDNDEKTIESNEKNSKVDKPDALISMQSNEEVTERPRRKFFF